MSQNFNVDEDLVLSLIQKIVIGDQNAFESLFKLLYPPIYKTIKFITASDYLSEEVVQDIFIRIWIQRSRLLEINNIHAYLFTMSRNAAYKALKKTAKERSFNELDNDDVIDWMEEEEFAFQKERIWSLYDSAIQALPLQQKKVYILTKQNKLSRKEVATVLNLSPESIKKYLALAKLNIRSFCQKNAEDLLPILFIFYLKIK